MTGQLKTVLLLGVLTALVVGAGSFAAPGYAWAFAVGGVAMNVVMWFFSDRMVLKMSGARPLPREEAPALHQMVTELRGRPASRRRSSTSSRPTTPTRSPPAATRRTGRSR